MRNRVLNVLAFVSTVGFAVMFAFALLGGAAPGWSYHPDTATTKEMMASLKPATSEQTAALQQSAAKSGDPVLIAASKKVYVATSNVAIAPTDVPTTIILPNPLKWTHGQLGNVVLLRTNGTTLDDLKSAYAFTDALCEAQSLGMAPDICNNIAARQPGDWNKMVSDMRHPTEAELKKWLGKDYVEGDAGQYYVAGHDFIAAPQYTFDGNDDKASKKLILGVFLMPGVQVIGGQLGYMDLYRLTAKGDHDATVTDSLCFMAGSPKVWPKDGDTPATANFARTADFAPKAEIERVSRCTR